MVNEGNLMRVFSVSDNKVAIECDRCKKIYIYSRQYFSSASKEECIPNLDIVCPNCKNKVLAGTAIKGNNEHHNYNSYNKNTSQKMGSGFLIGIVTFLIILLLAIIGGSMESDYERAGKEFETWIGEDPSTWTDTEKQYFNDFWEWADKN